VTEKRAVAEIVSQLEESLKEQVAKTEAEARANRALREQLLVAQASLEESRAQASLMRDDYRNLQARGENIQRSLSECEVSRSQAKDLVESLMEECEASGRELEAGRKSAEASIRAERVKTSEVEANLMKVQSNLMKAQASSLKSKAYALHRVLSLVLRSARRRAMSTAMGVWREDTTRGILTTPSASGTMVQLVPTSLSFLHDAPPPLPLSLHCPSSTFRKG
jgi:chromosome segregation ATPase